MTTLNYDKILSITVDREKIHYGILFGNEKIVFIKVGTAGNIRGNQDKYLRMAHRLREKIGATVICASNGELTGDRPLRADKFLIRNVITDLGFEACEMYFVGTSDGGEHSLKLALQFPETAAFLGLNASWSNMEEFLDGIQRLPEAKKTFVYGAKDSDFADIAPRLQSLIDDNLALVVLEGVDHEFSSKVDLFVTLIDLLFDHNKSI